MALSWVNMLNLRSNRTLWSNFPKGHPSSHYSSPSTLNFKVLSNPSNSSLHRHLLIFLAYQSYYTLLMSRTLFMFMSMMKFWKIFQTSRSYYVSFFEKQFKKNSKPIFFEFFWIFLPLDLESPVTFFLLGFWGF